jgi:heme/copper-type cytochrome/quinol oxidase subunit 4
MDHAVSDDLFVEGRVMALRTHTVWLLLILATLASWLLTEDVQAARFGATVVILIAAFKINLVVSYFMELGWQPQPFRIVISGWILFVSTIIIVGYWAA